MKYDTHFSENFVLTLIQFTKFLSLLVVEHLVLRGLCLREMQFLQVKQSFLMSYVFYMEDARVKKYFLEKK